jgi:hypothetical protein
MTGHEIRGWELVNTVDRQPASGLTERVYLWEKKGSAGKQLIRIGITETSEWRSAQAQLQSELGHSMRSDIPHGKGKLAKVGDVNFAAASTAAAEIAAVFFTRGNLTVTVASAGSETVDVTAVAASLDRLFSIVPTSDERAETPAIVRSLRPPPAEKGQAIELSERLPEPTLRNGWLKVVVPDGEIAREGERLIYRAATDGMKQIQQVVIMQDEPR